MQVFRFIFSPIEVNTYILADDSGKCAIIDCGCYSRSEFDSLSGFLEKNKLEPVILLDTHCHLDHIFGNKMFLEKYGIGSLSHELEEENRIISVQQASIFGLKMEEPPAPLRFLVDGEPVEFGSISLQVLHVPGHSAGSIAFYNKESGIVFTGDALFSGTIGRTDLPGGDFDTLINSIKSRLLVLPPATIVYPGHGAPTTIEKELKTNPYFGNSND